MPALSTAYELIGQLKGLNSRFDDINHAEKLDSFRSLCESFKRKDPTLECKENLIEITCFLSTELNKCTSRDVVRKLIIKCLNTLTKLVAFNTQIEAEIFTNIVKNTIGKLLVDESVLLANRLFILTIYLENLDKYGLRAISSIKEFSLSLLSDYCFTLTADLIAATAPIVVSTVSHNLQVLFKTLVIFLQKFYQSQLGETKDLHASLHIVKLKKTINSFLEKKELVNMELGYAASMIYILLTTGESEESLKELLEKILNKYTQGTKYRLEMSDLCLIQASFVMLKPEQFLQNNMIDLFQQTIVCTLKSSTESNDISHSIAISRAINFWETKLIEILQLKNEVLISALCRNHEEVWLNDLVTLIWLNFDHNIDVIRNLSMVGYKLLLQAAKSLFVRERLEAFHRKEIEKCMANNWQSNSVLNAINILLDNGISSNELIKLNPSVAYELIEVINERSTACLVSELYAKLFRGHRAEMKGSQALDECSVLWWSPIIRALETKAPIKKSFIYEYFLPRLMRLFPDGINYCQRIATDSSTLISCTRVSRSINSSNSETKLDNNEQSDNLYGTVSAAILQKSIISSDSQVRLDSFSLICDNPKTTEAISPIEFELIKKFLYFNSESSYPAFRQSIITSTKRLFFRLKESWNFFNKPSNRAAPESTSNRLATLYSDFIAWLFEFLLSSIHLDSTFAKRNQSLLILTHFIETFTDTADSNNKNKNVKDLFNASESFDRKRILTLVECLWDTYVNNKDLALQMLLKIDNKLFEEFEFKASEYFEVAIRLLSSRKPIDSMTSVYLMMFLQKKSSLASLQPKEKLAYGHDPLLAEGARTSLSMFLVQSIAKEFESHCKSAKENLLIASLKTPVYGSLSAIHELINHSAEEIMSSGLIAEWKSLLARLMELCFEVSQVVGPIVNSSSPEGIFPAELSIVEPTDQSESDHLQQVTPQMLLVCCWRTMKEISLFFGDIVKILPIEHEVTASEYILSEAQVFRIGDYFVRHLFETRHRGAFELAYVGFTSVCGTFWKCRSQVYCEQPNRWLDYVLGLIQTEQARNKICETRRGGGIPFYVQAIVSSEIAENGRRSLERSMAVLLQLAERNFDADEQNFSKVLAMYILTALFKNTRIGEDVLKYAEAALIVAINSFDSIYWNVRNGGSLLFCSLMNRIFGSARSKETIAKKNSMPGKMFFTKFPKLYQFFDAIIRESVELLDTNLNAKLYLVVLIFCHLFTLSDQLSDPEALLHTYVPSLLDCCKSPVLKTRAFIAKALAAIVCLDRYPTLIQVIFEHYSKNYLLKASGQVDNNYVDGVLQVLVQLVQKHDVFKFSSIDELFGQLLEPIRKHKLKHCPINYMNYLKLLSEVFYANMTKLAEDPTQASNLDSFISSQAYLIDESIDCLPVTCKAICLEQPGTHDYLQRLSESVCILIEAKSLKNKSFPAKSEHCHLLAGLLDYSKEYETYLVKGFVSYYKRLLGLNERLEVNEELVVKSNRIMNGYHKQLNEVICSLVKKNVFYSIANSHEVNNRLNLKVMCEYLTIYIRLSDASCETISKNDLLSTWKSLVKLSYSETETETRVTLMNTMTNVFEHISKDTAVDQIETEFQLGPLVDSMDCYLDRDNEANALSMFLYNNCLFLYSPQNPFNKRALKLWEILLQLLLQSEQESSKIASRIISRLTTEFSAKKEQRGEKFEYDTIAMNKLAIELFVEMYFERFPCETFVFLLNQYELVCEFEAAPIENEEEFEVCFDKGVESIQNSYFYYLMDLCEILNNLLLGNRMGSYLAQTEAFNNTFRSICNRLELELNTTAFMLKRMHFNDLKFTKVASHLMFLQKLAPFTRKSNQDGLSEELRKLRKKGKFLNSFMHVYLK